MTNNSPSELSAALLSRLRVERALHELRLGLPIMIRSGNNKVQVASAERAVEKAEFLPPGRLVISAARARRLGLATAKGAALALTWPQTLPSAKLAQIIDPRCAPASPLAALEAGPASAAEQAALRLAKWAALLPALLVRATGAPHAEIGLHDIEAYKHALAASLKEVGRACVPLEQAGECEIIAFRPEGGMVEHLAIVIGTPNGKIPLVRLHSSCLTGDILGSLRCDCGSQLREAMAAIHRDGYGMVVYLNQEGRGIGITNKLRAYQLQDQGMDTVDANEELGFDADERHFEPAAFMLRALGAGKIRLMTNNPRKVTELEHYGIAVTERVALIIPPNPHNAQYLETKAKRCGHLF